MRYIILLFSIASGALYGVPSQCAYEYDSDNGEQPNGSCERRDVERISDEICDIITEHGCCVGSYDADTQDIDTSIITEDLRESIEYTGMAFACIIHHGVYDMRDIPEIKCLCAQLFEHGFSTGIEDAGRSDDENSSRMSCYLSLYMDKLLGAIGSYDASDAELMQVFSQDSEQE